MCFGGGSTTNTNVTPAPYSVNQSQAAVKGSTNPSATPTTPHGLQPDAYDPNVNVPTASPTPVVNPAAAPGMNLTGM